MTKYVLVSKCHLQARAKQFEKNAFMTKYVLISKCHLQACAKQLETNVFMTKYVLFQNVIYRRARNSLKQMFL